MEDENMIETEPVLNAVGSKSQSNSPPHMQGVDQMEMQYNVPAHQVAMTASQQRAAALQIELNRQKEIQRLKEQS